MNEWGNTEFDLRQAQKTRYVKRTDTRNTQTSKKKYVDKKNCQESRTHHKYLCTKEKPDFLIMFLLHKLRFENVGLVHVKDCVTLQTGEREI